VLLSGVEYDQAPGDELSFVGGAACML